VAMLCLSVCAGRTGTESEEVVNRQMYRSLLWEAINFASHPGLEIIEDLASPWTISNPKLLNHVRINGKGWFCMAMYALIRYLLHLTGTVKGEATGERPPVCLEKGGCMWISATVSGSLWGAIHRPPVFCTCYTELRVCDPISSLHWGYCRNCQGCSSHLSHVSGQPLSRLTPSGHHPELWKSSRSLRSAL
jgi:hypothetical protein